MTETNWHYAQGEQTYGPVSFAALRDLAARGTVQRNTLVWCEGMTEWMPAEAVAALWLAGPTSVTANPGYIGYQVPTSGEFNYAGFWLRFVAYLIDGIITVIGGMIAGGLAGAVIGGVLGATHQSTNSITYSAAAAGQVLGILVAWLYYALMESSPRQATLGKMAMGLYVTDLSERRLTFGRATGRFFGKYLSTLTLCIGFMMAGWTVRKQALHDMLAGTLVLRR